MIRFFVVLLVILGTAVFEEIVDQIVGFQHTHGPAYLAHQITALAAGALIFYFAWMKP